jgi:hypothetical protein
LQFDRISHWVSSLEKKPVFSICFTLIIIFSIGLMLSEYSIIFGYVLENPSSMAFFIIYIGAGVIGLIAWLVVGYQGRPLNPSSFSHVDDLASTGYIDYEHQKDYD